MSVFGELILWVLTQSVKVALETGGDHCFLYYDEIRQIDLELALAYEMVYEKDSAFFKSDRVIRNTNLLTRMLDYKMYRLGLYCPEFAKLWEKKRLQKTWFLCVNYDI